jgi:hypothetical protein
MFPYRCFEEFTANNDAFRAYIVAYLKMTGLERRYCEKHICGLRILYADAKCLLTEFGVTTEL